jgi:alpha-galactosidase
MKIAFIGGGSVQWTARLVIDMALTPELADAQLVLHDIDAKALTLLDRVCKRIVAQAGVRMEISSTLDRTEALRGADFVILCVAIGLLPAMRHDLEIPERYGIKQTVGDTVGPGGLARGLRHIPFAVQVAREMETLCPQAWMLNLTNPMTTICRAISRASRIRVIGLCHEASGLRLRLAEILDAPPETIHFDVAGINHLPVILRLRIGQEDGMAVIRRWLDEHGGMSLANEHLDDIGEDIFHDRMAVKFTLFERMDTLFGSGDRHVAEFFAGFLNPESEYGERYGLVLTTIEHRELLLQLRRAMHEAYLEGAHFELEKSDEQLAPVMAALCAGPPGEFYVNVPNQGQIENLPLDAVVECSARVDALGVRPLSMGRLPNPAYAVIAGHVARQEIIVEAALSGESEMALQALVTDPLVRDLESAPQMLSEMLAANRQFMDAS